MQLRAALGRVGIPADHDDPVRVARRALKPSLRLPTYVGDEDAVVRRVNEHLAAGADHVCVEVLTGDDTTVPLDAWRRLAPALTTG